VAAATALRGVRKIYGTLGRNWVGKPTTIRMVLGTLTPDRGDVL